MVTDILEFFVRVQKSGAKEVTVCIRPLDGLLLKGDSFFNFVAMITKYRGLKVLVIFQIYKFISASWHPRMMPYLGLGLVMSFTGEELMTYDRKGKIRQATSRGSLHAWSR